MRRFGVILFGLGVARFAAGASGEAAQANASTQPQPELAEIVFGGRTQPIHRDPAANAGRELVYAPLQLHRSDLPLNFKIVSQGGAARPVIRLRTRLQGLEADWQDRDGMMWLVLRFLDADRHAVSSVSFVRHGESSGWAGVPQGSRFQSSIEHAAVPEGARKLQLLLVSGGTPRTTGFWALRRLRILAAKPGTEALEELYALDRLQGTNLGSRRGSPRGWSRDGTSLATPQVYSMDGEASQPMLALIDVDPINTGGWLASADNTVAVEPGMRLRLELEELYSIGRGGDDMVGFRSLPVGDYVFQVRGTDEFGRAAGPSLRIPVRVLPPFHQTTWFRIATVVASVALLLGLVRYVTWRRMQRQLQRLERRRAIEEERTRIARDIHDEMGSRLTQISILAARAHAESGASGREGEAMSQIQTATRDLVTALDEIVWAANPKLDTLEGVGNYLSQYADTVLRNAGVRCRFDIPPLLPARPISSGMRHRFMMAVKEALTNVLKHAKASEVQVRLTYTADALEVTIADDGIGFDSARATGGNGLGNLRHRLSEMGGSCTIESAVARGTSVTLRLPLPAEEET